MSAKRPYHPKRKAADLKPAPCKSLGGGGLRASMLALVRNESALSISKHRGVSGMTQAQRLKIIGLIAKQLREAGFRLHTADQIKGRHVRFLFLKWHEEGKALSTLQSRRTILKWVCDLAGKRGLVEKLSAYLPPGAPTRRTLIATVDRAWDANGVSADEVIEDVGKRAPWAKALLALIHSLGLRRAEAVCFRPRIALIERHGMQLVWIRERGWGSKGGRERFIPISSPRQIDAITYASTFCSSDDDAVMRSMGLSKKAAIDRFRRVCASCGITKKLLGVTLHGLRHQYFHERILTLDGGMESPVKVTGYLLAIADILESRRYDQEGELRRALQAIRATRWAVFDVDDLDEIERLDKARAQVSKELGHERVSITGAYAGSYSTLLHLLRKYAAVLRASPAASIDELADLIGKPVRAVGPDDGTSGEEGDWDS